MTRLLGTLAVLVVLAGCGSAAGPAGPALQQTAEKLETIESGTLSLSVAIDPKDGDEFGYEIVGPIRLAAEGELPQADVRYTQRADGEEETVRLVLTEDGGWIERDGDRTELTEAQLEDLQASGSLLGQEGLQGLDFDRWIVDPQRSDGPDDTDKITGELNVVAALNGLAELSGMLSSGPLDLDDAQRDQVEDAVKDSSFELLTGKEDRLLRKLALMVELDAEVPEELREQLGHDVVGARFEFDLALDGVNEPVQIG